MSPRLWVSSAITFLAPAIVAAQSMITRHNVTVAGSTAEWTPTGIQVGPGDIILVIAQGRERSGGSSAQSALLLKIGGGPERPVREDAFITADRAGEVNVRCANAVEVSIIHIPADAIPNVGTPIAAVQVSDTLVREVAAMRHDLRDLVVREESFFADSVRYSQSIEALGFKPSPGVTITIDQVAGEAWRGRATHSAAPGWTCGIYVGNVPRYLPDQKEGVPRCWKAR